MVHRSQERNTIHIATFKHQSQVDTREVAMAEIAEAVSVQETVLPMTQGLANRVIGGSV